MSASANLRCLERIKLDVLPGFIISGWNLNNVRYPDDTVSDRKKTTTPTECGERKRKVKTKYQLLENGIHNA